MLPALLLSHLPGNGVGLGAQPGGLGPRWSPAAEKAIIAETFKSGEGEGPPAQNRNGKSTTECPTLSSAMCPPDPPPTVPHPPTVYLPERRKDPRKGQNCQCILELQGHLWDTLGHSKVLQ